METDRTIAMKHPDLNTVSRTADQREFTVFGTWMNATLPRDLPLFFQEGVFINRDNNKPMEQDAYSIYLALRAMDRVYRTNYTKERKEIIDAVLKRMHDCGGFWTHGEWTGSDEEIHMRYSAAAIRLLIEALEEGLLEDPSIIIVALKRHLLFSEPLTRGVWFFHDSFEGGRCRVKRPSWASPLRNNVWGSSYDNCLVLNTHIDTLITILDVLQRVDVNETDRRYLISQLEAGACALKIALRPQESIVWVRFARIDSAIRSALFGTYAHRTLAATLLRQVFWQLFSWVYVPIRQRIRSRFPAYDFPDGYLERDIGLRGISFEYHVVNIHDLAKFVLQATRSGLIGDSELISRCKHLIDRGLDYAIQSNYFCYLLASTKRRGWAIQLCEAILARLAIEPKSPTPPHWIKGYCAVRRALPPTAAILGYDPLMVGDAGSRDTAAEGIDYVRLRDGRALAIDFVRQTFTFENSTPAHTQGESGVFQNP